MNLRRSLLGIACACVLVAVVVACSSDPDPPAGGGGGDAGGSSSSSSSSSGDPGKPTEAGTPGEAPKISLISPTSLRIRADNEYGVAKQNEKNPTALPFSATDSILDEEDGSAAKATSKATYAFTQEGNVTTFTITAEQDYSVASHNALAEGSIIIKLENKAQFSVDGNLDGQGTNGDDHAFQQRTFIRRFESPYETLYLEDETRNGVSAALKVNQSDDGLDGGSFNHEGPKSGVIGPGTFELQYELEERDTNAPRDGTSKATGKVVFKISPTPG